jgi:hypothetical protein
VAVYSRTKPLSWFAGLRTGVSDEAASPAAGGGGLKLGGAVDGSGDASLDGQGRVLTLVFPRFVLVNV